MARILACAAVVVVVAHPARLTEPQKQFLKRIAKGDVGKDELAIILAQRDEDLSWSSDYGKVRTVYCKGSTNCAAGAVHLPNVGREGHTFLYHIVNNYDKLAKWTVFSQAGEPSTGYKGQNRGGGHMLTGAAFEDYVTHPHRPNAEDPDAFFLMTHKVHLPTLQHALRSTYQVGGGPRVPERATLPPACPTHHNAKNSTDVWGEYAQMPWLRNFVLEKCGLTGDSLGEAMRLFWDSFVQLPRPAGDIVHYAQGARFGVSRERIQQRPKAFYERLLSLVSKDTDPCGNYLFEYVWYFLVGKSQRSPCDVTVQELTNSWSAPTRFLTTSGESGASGDPGTNVDACPRGAAASTVALAASAMTGLLLK